MNANCCCLTDDVDDQLEAFEERYLVGKKDYRCCECNRPIPEGERHLYSKGVSDGEWHTYRTCLGCSRLIDEYSCGGRVFGSLADDIEECFGTSIIWDEEEDKLK